MARSLEGWMEAKLTSLRALEPQRKAQPFTMFRVPAYVRERNRAAYEPRMVSIGPYYRGAAGLGAMEEHKWRHLVDLLARRAQVLSVSSLIGEMRSLEARARACYSESTALFDSDGFVLMLLLDGCFILEFCFKRRAREPDALRDVGWGLTLLTTDLLLLENQIPFFVLETLYAAAVAVDAAAQPPWRRRESLVSLLLDHVTIDGEKPVTRPSCTADIHHLLHLYYESFVPKRRSSASAPPPALGLSRSAATTRVIPRATEMSAAGVVFAPRASAADMYDVAFDGGRGVMEIPAVVIDDMKRPLLINLIAFEQSQLGCAAEDEEQARVLASYVSLMAMLVRTAQDVELLNRRGVLDNLLADDDEAARFFSHLGDGGAMNFDNQVFTQLYEDVRRYCGSWWHRNRAALRRDYFGSPWLVISFVVAGLVLAFAATQTYFTVFPNRK